MIRGNEPAFPMIGSIGSHDGDYSPGLTKRELISIENHAQLIRFVVREQMTSEFAASLAAKHADALIAELEKRGGAK